MSTTWKKDRQRNLETVNPANLDAVRILRGLQGVFLACCFDLSVRKSSLLGLRQDDRQPNQAGIA